MIGYVIVAGLALLTGFWAGIVTMWQIDARIKKDASDMKGPSHE
jgi:hypothetical protein